jgi:adenylate cyclase
VGVGKGLSLMTIADFKKDVSDEVATVLSSDFTINVVETSTVPHSADPQITFPNLDAKTQGSKRIETTVLYIDMRRSTQLSLRHKPHTVAKLYSAFVRAMARCAESYGGEVRGIIGDRVMVLFDPQGCFENAVNTATLMNSVCQYVLNTHFSHGEVTFGIGIDFGYMLATKTGIVKRGHRQHSYRSLVWLGRPANIASKLTDNANKPEETSDLMKLNVAYQRGITIEYKEEYPYVFVQQFTHDPIRNLMAHRDPTFKSFTIFVRTVVMREKTPPILMSARVYNGLRRENPNADVLVQELLRRIDITIKEQSEDIYGGDVIFTAFRS